MAAKKKLKVEYVPIKSLKPFKGNPRKNADTVDSVVRSIEAFGYTNPILARRKNKEVIAGHTRLMALKKLGAKEAPVIFLDLDQTDARVYGIFDNKSVENTQWDFPALADLFVEFDQLNVSMDLTGFSEGEIAYLITGPQEVRDEYQNMPEFENENQIYRTLKIHFANEKAVQKFAALLKQKVTEKTQFLWFPKTMKASTKRMRIVND